MMTNDFIEKCQIRDDVAKQYAAAYAAYRTLVDTTKCKSFLTERDEDYMDLARDVAMSLSEELTQLNVEINIEQLLDI